MKITLEFELNEEQLARVAEKAIHAEMQYDSWHRHNDGLIVRRVRDAVIDAINRMDLTPFVQAALQSQSFKDRLATETAKACTEEARNSARRRARAILKEEEGGR